MYSATTNSRTTGSLSSSNAGPRCGATKLAAAIIRAALALAALLALLPIATRPAQAQAYGVMHSFTGGLDGAYPQSNLTSDGAGNLYGTTNSGGAWGYGTVYELSLNGNETTLYSFCSALNCADGANATYSYVMFDKQGNLYGTTYSGGAHGYGVVFELSPGGASWTETVLYSFAGGADGGNPVNGLIMDVAGNLYGKTTSGGGGDGVVFELSPSGDGWTEQAIYAPGTAASHAALTMDAAGNIFGTTGSTVFEVSPNGHGGWNPKVIHTFTGAPKDGSGAQGTPALDNAGNLYGTTASGGARNLGTVYELRPGKRGTWIEKILYAFGANKKDRSIDPEAGIVFDAAGNMYGTTANNDGGGTLFELVAHVGKTVYYRYLDRWNFWWEVGQVPVASPILYSAGSLYGTTEVGGDYGYGDVYGYWWAAGNSSTSAP